MIAVLDIIDDDEAVRDSMEFLLQDHGYSVRTHASAEQFLAAFAPSGCLLVDQHMPGMTGLELLEHIRVSGDRTPALMITGRSDSSILNRAQKLAIKVLHKPVEVDYLVAQIESARAQRS